jgi:23S rRNA (guanosine2251-2'-O)-methyltransferase
MSKHTKKSMKELKRIDVSTYKSSEKMPVVLVLDNIRSLNNIGSAFRTADAFRVEKIFLCGITASPPHREIYKTALGATESVEWQYCETTMDAIKEIKEQKISVVAVEQCQKSVLLNEYSPLKGQKTAFVFGNEVDGVLEEVLENCDKVVEIPQYGTKHSLNISVSIGIVLWRVFEEIKFF